MKAYQAVDADGIACQWIPPGADPRHPKGVWVRDNGQQLGPQVQDNPAAAAPGTLELEPRIGKQLGTVARPRPQPCLLT